METTAWASGKRRRANLEADRLFRFRLISIGQAKLFHKIGLFYYTEKQPILFYAF